MQRVALTELKNRLSHFIRLVKSGETIEILERRVPVARIEAIGPQDAAASGLRERLIREGIITPRRRRRAAKLPPPIPCAVDAVRILIEERGER